MKAFSMLVLFMFAFTLAADARETKTFAGELLPEGKGLGTIAERLTENPGNAEWIPFIHEKSGKTFSRKNGNLEKAWPGTYRVTLAVEDVAPSLLQVKAPQPEINRLRDITGKEIRSSVTVMTFSNRDQIPWDIRFPEYLFWLTVIGSPAISILGICIFYFMNVHPLKMRLEIFRSIVNAQDVSIRSLQSSQQLAPDLSINKNLRPELVKPHPVIMAAPIGNPYTGLVNLTSGLISCWPDLEQDLLNDSMPKAENGTVNFSHTFKSPERATEFAHRLMTCLPPNTATFEMQPSRRSVCVRTSVIISPKIYAASA
jgi:hypothetical protein